VNVLLLPSRISDEKMSDVWPWFLMAAAGALVVVVAMS